MKALVQLDVSFAGVAVAVGDDHGPQVDHVVDEIWLVEDWHRVGPPHNVQASALGRRCVFVDFDSIELGFGGSDTWGVLSIAVGIVDAERDVLLASSILRRPRITP